MPSRILKPSARQRTRGPRRRSPAGDPRICRRRVTHGSIVGMRGVFFARTSTSKAEIAAAKTAGNRIVSVWTKDAMREAAWDGYCGRR